MNTLLSLRILCAAAVLLAWPVTGCSSADENGGDGSTASDLSASDEACAKVNILCPTGSHCEAQGGKPTCVSGSKVGFFPPNDGGPSAHDGGSKVGFFGK